MEGLAAELAATFGPTDYVVLIDEVNNRVEVELSEEARRTTEGVWTAEGIAADPMIELDPEPLEIEQIACVNRDNCTPYRSGLALDLFDTDSSASDPCSSGFAARNAAGARYLLTAGHCVFNAGGSNNSGVNVYSPVGTFVGGIPSTGWYDNDNVRVDAARIYLGSSGSRASVYQDNAYKDLRVGGVAWASSTGATQMQIGNYLCKAGRSTGGSCGTVDAVFIAANGDNGQFRISGPNACALGGDSGAGVYGSSTAWGNAVYSNRSTACSSAPYFGGSHADFIESVLDITIETR